MRTALRPLLLLAALVALAGCKSATSPRPPQRPPTEGETRDAYFDTPVIAPGMTLPRLGSTRAAVFRRLGVATISYRAAAAPNRECVVYPIGGTERWDAFGSPEADEWQLCFDRRGHLVSRRRLRPPRLQPKLP